MTSVNKTQGPGPIGPNNHGNKVQSPVTPQVQTTGYVQITSGADSFGRENLDEISPYAAMGVSISPLRADDISARTQKEAEEMFPSFRGYYTLPNPQEANYELADMNFRLQTRTDAGANRYVDTHTNRTMAVKHLEDGGYAAFLAELDTAMG